MKWRARLSVASWGYGRLAAQPRLSLALLETCQRARQNASAGRAARRAGRGCGRVSEEHAHAGSRGQRSMRTSCAVCACCLQPEAPPVRTVASEAPHGPASTQPLLVHTR